MPEGGNMHTVLSHSPTAEPVTTTPAKNQLLSLSVERIVADEQVRRSFNVEPLKSLAESLKSEGQLVPILVFLDEARDLYVLLDGERRWRAAKLAGLATLEAVVFPYRPSSAEVGVAQLNLDLQREALDPIDQALAFARVMRENEWSPTELAAQIHIALSTVTRAVGLLTFPEDLQELIRTRELFVAVARELARLPEEAQRRAAWAQVKEGALTSAQTQKLVNALLKETGKPKRGRPKSTNRQVYRGLSGFEAVVCPTKVTLIAASKKARTKTDILAALELLVQKLREDLAPKTEANIHLPASH
jgi:ParB family chromosome partitioning protein